MEKLKKYITAFLLLLLVTSFLSLPKNSHAAMSSWQKGVSITPNWDGEYGTEDFKKSIDALAKTGANYVTLIIPLYQSSQNSADIQKGGNTPTDAALISGITYAHSKGLKVMLKPHLEIFSHEWRAYINAQDRGAWFTNYGNMILAYAKIAKDYNVEDFCIGAELVSMSSASVNGTNTQNWKNLIQKVRAVYAGKLTYSANWGPSGFTDEKNNIQFWDSLDYIGVAAYFNLYGDNSVQNLKNQWDGYRKNDIQPLSQKWNKPIVFTEIGYRSVSNAHTQPWDYSLGGAYDGQGQVNAYQALFEYWQAYDYMQGVQLWDWKSNPSAGGNANTDYTPQNKPAQGVMTEWFSSSGSETPPGGVPKFLTTASVSPNPVKVGVSANISAVVKNEGESVGNIIVDLEIYNSNNQKVFQKYFDNQAFVKDQSHTYAIAWTPNSAGDYKLKIGIFNYNWSQNYLWVDNALVLSTSNTSPPPPPADSQIEIWWPTNGATISGVQPFKALYKNMSVDQYSMYWQVDGGGLVHMPTNNTDYPHKEFLVNVAGWNWRGDGPYAINFVVKDLAGNILAQKSVSVIVAH